jgi:CHASE2 domain-containing sensor protein
MEFAPIFWWTTLWLLVWGIVGSIGTRRIYLAKDLDTSNAVLMGALIGASLGSNRSAISLAKDT